MDRPLIPKLGNVMNDEQKAAYQQLLKKRSETLKKTSTDQAKKYVNITIWLVTYKL